MISDMLILYELPAFDNTNICSFFRPAAEEPEPESSAAARSFPGQGLRDMVFEKKVIVERKHIM